MLFKLACFRECNLSLQSIAAYIINEENSNQINDCIMWEETDCRILWDTVY